MASPRDSIYSSLRGSGYESLTVTAFIFRWSTWKRSNPSFVAAKIIGADYSVWAGSITISVSIASPSCFSKSPARCLVRYGVEYMRWWLEGSNSMQLFASLIHPKSNYHMVWISSNVFINLCRFEYILQRSLRLLLGLVWRVSVSLFNFSLSVCFCFCGLGFLVYCDFVYVAWNLTVLPQITDDWVKIRSGYPDDTEICSPLYSHVSMLLKSDTKM